MKNKITLISGAGRGIGEEIAKKFYNEGHNLILLLYKSNQKKKLENQFDKKRVNYFVGDLKNKKFIQSVGKKVKYVDNLVNNAGIASGSFFQMLSISLPRPKNR